MKLAVKKEPGYIPGTGFHYMLHPYEMLPKQDEIYAMMGYHIVEVADDFGVDLLIAARTALAHQCQIAGIVEKMIRDSGQ